MNIIFFINDFNNIHHDPLNISLNLFRVGTSLCCWFTSFFNIIIFTQSNTKEEGESVQERDISKPYMLCIP